MGYDFDGQFDSVFERSSGLKIVMSSKHAIILGIHCERKNVSKFELVSKFFAEFRMKPVATELRDGIVEN